MSELRDELNIQSDRRKIQKLIDDGIVSAEDVYGAQVYMVCPECKLRQNPDNDKCEKCGTDIS